MIVLIKTTTISGKRYLLDIILEFNFTYLRTVSYILFSRGNERFLLMSTPKRVVDKVFLPNKKILKKEQILWAC